MIINNINCDNTITSSIYNNWKSEKIVRIKMILINNIYRNVISQAFTSLIFKIKNLF